MTRRGQDDLPYRSPMTQASRPEPVSNDEVNFSTLKQVQKILHESVDDLSKNFNAFEILSRETVEVAAANLLRQVEVNQGVYDILAPVVEAIDSAIQRLDIKYKER